MAKTTIAIYDKQQVDDLISEFGSDIDDLKNRMTDAETEISGLDDELTLKANVSDLPTSAELVPDYTQAATGQVLTRTATGTGWTTPAAGITITDMQTYYQITY